MPAEHYLTKMIVDTYHRKFLHQNEGTIICELRRHFWIPGVRNLVKKAKRDCNECKLRTTKPVNPQMGQLPINRLTPYVRPFTYTGLDYFGPQMITVARHREKRWVALFTCLTTRALHLEIAEDLSAEACLMCIQSFINRRGRPIRIRSDCGTNFIKASKKLRVDTTEDNNAKLQTSLAAEGIEWLFNCPANPSEGGCWERLVQSVKRVLSFTLKEVAPRVEILRNVLTEAENIVNSRPLTHINASSMEENPITPNHFLIGTANTTQTPWPNEEDAICLKGQYRLAQQLKNAIWKRWVMEYLPTLTRRTKWYKVTEPIKIHDLVIICDANAPRKQWQKGIVTPTKAVTAK